MNFELVNISVNDATNLVSHYEISTMNFEFLSRLFMDLINLVFNFEFLNMLFILTAFLVSN
jgi:hypothetical protein